MNYTDKVICDKCVDNLEAMYGKETIYIYPEKTIQEVLRKFRLKFNKKSFQKQEAYDYIKKIEMELGL